MGRFLNSHDISEKIPTLLSPVAAAYGRRLERFGQTPRGVFWRGKEWQTRRFDILTKIFNQTDLEGNIRIHDFGCGYGALFDYLADHQAMRESRYLGTDISKDMIDAAKCRISDPRAHFIQHLWPTESAEGQRRNAGINECTGSWVFEIDADERVPDDLARELQVVVSSTTADWHEIPVDNYVGERLVRYGWGASFGKAAYPGLFRKGSKVWGDQRVHPVLRWSGVKGEMLKSRLIHHVDRDISDMMIRLNSYSTARSMDLCDSGHIGSTANNVRRVFSRFFKCYFLRRGYREGGYGLLIAICAGLYPLLSHLKAKYDRE